MISWSDTVMADDYSVPDSLLRRFVDDLANRTILYQEAVVDLALVCVQYQNKSINWVDINRAWRRVDAAKEADREFLERWREYRR
jgi:hypothetical protein